MKLVTIRSYPTIGGRSSILNLTTRHAVVTGKTLRWVLMKWNVWAETGWSWLRIGIGGVNA